MNEKKDPPKKAFPGSKRKPPASLFLWLLAFLVLASLIVFNSTPYFSAPEEWTANHFLSQLDKGAVVSAEILPESDKILAISGEFKNVPKQADDGKAGTEEKENAEKAPEIVEKDLTKPAPAQTGNGNAAARRIKLKYTTRIYATDEIINKLDAKGQVSQLPHSVLKL